MHIARTVPHGRKEHIAVVGFVGIVQGGTGPKNGRPAEGWLRGERQNRQRPIVTSLHASLRAKKRHGCSPRTEFPIMNQTLTSTIFDNKLPSWSAGERPNRRKSLRGERALARGAQ